MTEGERKEKRNRKERKNRQGRTSKKGVEEVSAGALEGTGMAPASELELTLQPTWLFSFARAEPFPQQPFP